MFSRAFWRGLLPSRTLAIVLATALLLRVSIVLCVLSQFGPAWFFSRGSEMDFLARALLHHHGLSSPFGSPTGPTAIVAPGYPLLVAFIFYSFGIDTWAAALVLMILHAVLNTATVYLIYRLARRFAGERAACLAAMFWAYSLPLLWMPTIFWETSLSCLLMISSLFLALGVRRQPPVRFWFVCGSLSSLAGLFNPALLPSLLTLMVMACFQTTSPPIRLRSLGMFSLGLVLVFSPWPIRNARVLDACVLTRTTVGLELWMGNHAGSTGFLETSLFPTYNPAELAQYRHAGEIAYTANKGQLARTFIQDHPGCFLALSAKRFLRFWMGSGTRGGSALFTMHALISSCLGVSGLMLLWHRGQKRICFYAGVQFLLFPLPYYVTHAEFRYRLVIDSLLCAFSAPALQWLFDRLRATQKAAVPMDPRFVLEVERQSMGQWGSAIK